MPRGYLNYPICDNCGHVVTVHTKPHSRGTMPKGMGFKSPQDDACTKCICTAYREKGKSKPGTTPSPIGVDKISSSSSSSSFFYASSTTYWEDPGVYAPINNAPSPGNDNKNDDSTTNDQDNNSSNYDDTGADYEF